MSDETICMQAFVKGKVQGVGFRDAAAKEAARIGGLLGWVRNLENGDVEVVVQGPKPKVQQLLSWCHKGPGGTARVDMVDERQTRLEPSLRSFAVRRF